MAESSDVGQMLDQGSSGAPPVEHGLATTNRNAALTICWSIRQCQGLPCDGMPRVHAKRTPCLKQQ
jgi:hypothetical protein